MKEEKWMHKTLINESQKTKKKKTKKGERGGCGHAIQIKI